MEIKPSLYGNAGSLSGWPKEDLFNVVGKGRYRLEFRVRGDKESEK